jgi:hypothetical protein
MERILFIVIICLVIVTGTAGAQDSGDTIQCDPEQLQSSVGYIIADLQSAQDSGNLDTQYQGIVVAQGRLSVLNSLCLGLDFEGDREIVSDLVLVPEGIYRVTVTTPGYFIMRPTVIEGSCDPDGYSLFNLSDGEATSGAQAIFKSQKCAVLWEISNVTAPYKVTFEKMN